MSKCKYCNTDITWLKEGRKSVPVESDGAKHECENFTKARNSLKSMKPTDLDPDILKQYQENMNNALKKKK